MSSNLTEIFRGGRLPPPGLQGDYTGSCVVCGYRTDSGLVFEGEGEFLIAAMMRLGLPEFDAHAMIEQEYNCSPRQRPFGDLGRSSSGFKYVGRAPTKLDSRWVHFRTYPCFWDRTSTLTGVLCCTATSRTGASYAQHALIPP